MKKQKAAIIPKNIIIIDLCFDENKFDSGMVKVKKRMFNHQKDAEKYFESHPRPKDLEIDFDPKYKKLILEAFDKKMELKEIHIKVLNLIYNDNFEIGIKKVLDLTQKEWNGIIESLKLNNLITSKKSKLSSRVEYDITIKGENKLKKIK